LPPKGTEEPKDYADDGKDGTYLIEDADIEEGTQNDQNHSQDDHCFPFWY
jgi:hypothetical protein